MTNPNEVPWWWTVYLSRLWGGKPDSDPTTYEAIASIVAEAERRTWEEANTVLSMTYLADGITYGRDERCEKMLRLLRSKIDAKLSSLTKK